MTDNTIKVEPVYGPQGNKGEPGFSPLVRESPDNTSTVYKLLITDAEHTIVTPNLMTDIHNESVQTTIDCAKNARIYCDTAKEQSEIAAENTLTIIENVQVVTEKADDVATKAEEVTASTQLVQNCLSSAQEILDTINTKSFSTVRIGTVTTIEAGEQVEVTNSGTEKDIILDFKIPKGIQGEQGIQGIQGVQGERGETALTITIGSITTAESGQEAQVTNSGTDKDIILDFQLPRGIKGEQGIQGIQGERGLKGESGQGVPVGGSIGQILTKKSDVDFDTEWADSKGGSGGGTVSESPTGINLASISIMPDITKYREFITAQTDITFDLTNLNVTDNDSIDFELYLQNLTAAAVTIKPIISWTNGTVPDLSKKGKYKIRFTSFDKGESWIGDYKGTFSCSLGKDTPVIDSQWTLNFAPYPNQTIQFILDKNFANDGNVFYNAPIRIDWGDGTEIQTYNQGDITHTVPSDWVRGTSMEVTMFLDENNSMPWFTWGRGKDGKANTKYSTSPNSFSGPLPHMYRKINNNLYDVVDFSYWASGMWTSKLADYFFDNNPNATNFSHCFDQDSNILSLGKQPFRKLNKVTDYSYCCYGCSMLELESDLFGDEETLINEGFSKSVNFTYTFYCYSMLGDRPRGTAPQLWNYKYKYQPTTTHCFEGDGNKLLTNYAKIPAAWRT